MQNVVIFKTVLCLTAVLSTAIWHMALKLGTTSRETLGSDFTSAALALPPTALGALKLFHYNPFLRQLHSAV